MYYKKFSISKYKGINEVSLDLSEKKGVVTLIGLNESGKTTILEAISTFFNLVKRKQELSLENFEKIIPRSEIASFSDKVEIIAEIVIENTDALQIPRNQTSINLGLSISFDRGKYKNHEIKIHDSDSTATANSNSDENNDDLREIIIKKLPDIYFYDDFLETIPDSISYYEVAYQDINTKELEKINYCSDPKWGDILNEVFSKANNGEFFSTVISEFDFKKNKRSIDGKISKMGQYLTREISSLWQELTGKNYQFKEIVIKDVREDNIRNINQIYQISDYINMTIQYQGEQGTLLNFDHAKMITISIKVKNKDNSEFDIEERSKGCRWFFSFLLFTYFRKSNNCLFLLDEPGSNLHGSIQESICNKAFYELSKSCCVIYSTHSPYLINMDYGQYLYIVSNGKEKENDNTSVIEIQSYPHFFKENTDQIKLILDHIAFKLPSILNDKEKQKKFKDNLARDIKASGPEPQKKIKQWLTDNQKNLPNYFYKVLMAVLTALGI